MKPEEAIECIEAIHVQMFNSGNSKWTKACDMAIEALKEPKQGEWKRISMDKYIRHASFFYRCSVCGEDNIGETNFCPKCGFPMNEEALEILRKREGEKE